MESPIEVTDKIFTKQIVKLNAKIKLLREKVDKG